MAAAAKKSIKKEEPGKKAVKREAETEGHAVKKGAAKRGDDPSIHAR